MQINMCDNSYYVRQKTGKGVISRYCAGAVATQRIELWAEGAGYLVYDLCRKCATAVIADCRRTGVKVRARMLNEGK